MGTEELPMDEKAKRMRDLLSSFYSPDPSMSDSNNSPSKYASLDAINTLSFDPDRYMNLLVHKSNLEGLLQRHVEMAAEIKNLDTDLQMLVYENYNKFISATETIKTMNSNIVGMEANMEQLLEKIMSVQSRSDGVNTSLFEKREHIEKLHRTGNLLRKVQAYGDSSFRDCKRASEEAVLTIIKNLQGKLFSDSESIQSRAEAVVLLKQLDFPVDNLKSQLLEKLGQFLSQLQLEQWEMSTDSNRSNEPSNQGNAEATHEASMREFVEALRAFRVIFPDSEMQLVKLSTELLTKKLILLIHAGVVWTDVLLIDEVLPEAGLADFFLEAAHVAIKQYVASRFSHLIQDISDSLMAQTREKDGEEYSLLVTLEASKKTVLQGSMDVLLVKFENPGPDFRQLLDDKLDLLIKLKGYVIDWVQGGFQDFFRSLDDHFLFLSGKDKTISQDQGITDGLHGEKVLAGLVLVLAQLSVFIEKSAIPRVTEEIAASFSGGGVRDYEHGPAFIPGEICRIFRSTGEKFLHLYVKMKTQKISVVLKKRFTTPNWVKHKEPREVHMFVDLFLQELEAISIEVKQILPQGLIRRHHRSDSGGSTTSSRSNPLRDDKLIRSNTPKGRSQLLETHLAQLFKQKLDIFTKVEYTRESVVTTIVKLCLKSFQEFVRLQTFNRSGFQQIQLDIHFLRTPLKEMAEDEAVVDFLLDEVIVATSERCLDPIPLESPILEKLVQAKLARTKAQNPPTS
ncbi:hypothetical protein RJ641_030791 [Dillenia turbinata]|uniref:Vacuolar protein sorting-associated protein 51 homolog n=1 Tax=Dillenia turbinata TaxID=194707 RepID=A0AAN8VLH5_9MAGN